MMARRQRLSWISCKIAWRDLRSGRRHFVVAMASLAVGVAAMNASRALSSEFSRRLNGDMRHWIAADAAVTLRQPPSEEQRGAMVELARQGIEESDSLETHSTISSDQAADPVVVSVRSVDARRYPWYGTVELEPNRPLREALEPDTAVVSRILAERLAVAPGDRVLLNGVAFRIAAVLLAEPDRLAAAPNPYPRVMLSDAAFVRTRIARLGNAIVFRLLFRVGAGSDTGQLKARLQQLFPDGQIVDYRDHGDRRVAAALDATLTYLGLAAWAALALGSLGVAMVTYLHMEQRLDTVAIMKALGGRWRQILWIYLLEITCLSLAGCVLGAALAVPLERVFPLIFADQLPFPLALPWRWTEAAEAVGLGLLSSLVATAMPLVAVRTAPPLLVLRRYVEPSPGRRQIGRMVGMASLLGMLGLALWMVHSWKAGAAFLFGLAAGGLILLGTGRALLRRPALADRRRRQSEPAGTPGRYPIPGARRRDYGRHRLLARAGGRGSRHPTIAPLTGCRSVCLRPRTRPDRPADGTPGGRSGRGAAGETAAPGRPAPVQGRRCSGARHHPRALGGCLLQPCAFRTSFGGALVAAQRRATGNRGVGVAGWHDGREGGPDAGVLLQRQGPSGAHRGPSPPGRCRRSNGRAGFSVHCIRRTKRLLRGRNLGEDRARGGGPATACRQLSQRPGD